jgi:hypothetical protein
VKRWQTPRFLPQDLRFWPKPDRGPVRAQLVTVPLVSKRVIVHAPAQPTSPAAPGPLSVVASSLPPLLPPTSPSAGEIYAKQFPYMPGR